MKKGNTLLLKAALAVMTLPVIGFLIFVMPVVVRELNKGLSGWFDWMMFGMMVIVFLTVLPYVYVLYQSFCLLQYIDQKRAFSALSIRALANIRNGSLVVSGLYLLGMPLFFLFAEVDDAPGVVLIAFLFFFAPFVISVFASLLKKLLEEAYHFKTENDYTV